MPPRKQKLAPKWRNIQSREPWADRAWVLYLRDPAIFSVLIETPHRFNNWHVPVMQQALELAGGRPVTSYRLKLLCGACLQLWKELKNGTNTERTA
jgi:hypothetical protein